MTLNEYIVFFEEVLEARRVTVVRGGKKIKAKLVKVARKKIRSSAQKAGARKGAIKRRAKKNVANRKRAKSLKVRKRLNLKDTPRKNKEKIRF